MLFKMYICGVVNIVEELKSCSLTYFFFDARSKHEEIDLVPEEEFYNDAPPDISRPNLTKTDSHQLTLARLDWELEQRKRSVTCTCHHK